MKADIELTLAEHGMGTHLKIDGVDVTENVKAISIAASADDHTHFVVEYACVTGVVNGEVEVTHWCPLGKGQA